MLSMLNAAEDIQALILKVKAGLERAERATPARRTFQTNAVALDVLRLSRQVEALLTKIDSELDFIPMKKREKTEKTAVRVVGVVRGELQAIQTRLICLNAA